MDRRLQKKPIKLDLHSPVVHDHSLHRLFESTIERDIESGARLFYFSGREWHHFTKYDVIPYNSIMKSIKKLYHMQYGPQVKRAKKVVIGLTSLYPLLVECEEFCPGYFSLMLEGLVEYGRYVPYLFVHRSQRDDVLCYIMSVD